MLAAFKAIVMRNLPDILNEYENAKGYHSTAQRRIEQSPGIQEMGLNTSI